MGTKYRQMTGTALATGFAVCGLLAGVGHASTAGPGKNATTSTVPPVSMFGAYPGFTSSLTDNTFTTFAEKLTGLTFTFDTVDSADVATKQGILLASGDYPDVIWGGSITAANAVQYGNEGIFRPLQDIIKRYAPNLWHNIQTIPGYKSAVTAPNGNIYALPAYNYCPHCSYTYQDFINAYYLNKFGLSLPRTTAQFAHVLSVFKDHGITPLSGAIDTYDADPIQFLMNAFIPFDGDLTTGENDVDVSNSGKVYFAPTQPQWRQGLEYIYSLYKSGDFGEEVFTQQPAVVESLIDENKLGVVPIGAISVINPEYGQSGSHYLDWVGLPPLKGPGGVSSAAFAGTGIPNTFTTAITNRASQAQEIGIMKLLNYINSPEGSLAYDIGNKYVAPAAKGTTGLVPGPALWSLQDPSTDYVSSTFMEDNAWYQFGPYYFSTADRLRQVSPAPFTPSGSVAVNQLWTEVGPIGHQAKLQYPTTVFVPTASTSSFSTEQTNIDNYVDEWTDEFVTGAKSITGDWSSYVSGLKALGLTSYLETLQKAGKPLDTDVPLYEKSPSDIKFLLCKGPVPALMKTYIVQSGVPASDFACK